MARCQRQCPWLLGRQGIGAAEAAWGTVTCRFRSRCLYSTSRECVSRSRACMTCRPAVATHESLCHCGRSVQWLVWRGPTVPSGRWSRLGSDSVSASKLAAGPRQTKTINGQSLELSTAGCRGPWMNWSSCERSTRLFSSDEANLSATKHLSSTSPKPLPIRLSAIECTCECRTVPTPVVFLHGHCIVACGSCPIDDLLQRSALLQPSQDEWHQPCRTTNDPTF